MKIAGLVFLSAVPFAAGLMRLFGLATSFQAQERFSADPIPGILHIVGATCFATIGAFQFSPRLRETAWHRVAGRVLGPFGLVAAVSGTWMALTWPPRDQFDGASLTVIRVVVGGAMIVMITTALIAAFEKEYDRHGRWMTRAYALGAGAGTQVFTYLPFVLFESIRSVATNTACMVAGWLINVAVAEWALRQDRDDGPTMKALRHDRYGGPEVLTFANAPLPHPGPGQVRVRVRAASINAMDYRLMRADPFLVRLQCGVLRPRDGKLGADFAGVIDAVGAGVTQFRVGDEVYGHTSLTEGLGAFAEAVVVVEGALAKRPERLDFAHAAAIPLACITALQAVRGRVSAGHRVLIHGAGGGVGMALVQLAKAYGAHVTAVCGPKSAALVAELGADHVVDYTREHAGGHYDVIFGVNGFRSLRAYREALAAGGTYVMVGGSNRQIFEALLLGRVYFRGDRRVAVLTIANATRQRDLDELSEWIAKGKLRIVVDRVFPFSEAPAAFRYVTAGHVRGKVVLALA